MTTTTVKTGKSYTQPQLNFVLKLTADREVPVAGKDVQEAVLIARHEDMLGGGKFVSVREASDVIDWLKTLPSAKPAPAKDAPAKPAEPLTAGFYVVPATGEIIFITKTKDKQRLYAKAMCDINGERLTTGGEIVNWEWRYAPGLVQHIRPEWKMPADMGAQLGIKAGKCLKCKRGLKAAKSVAAMIGPVCIKYFA